MGKVHDKLDIEVLYDMSCEHTPVISVLIISHRREYLLEAVNSVITQTLDGKLFEIIVILDYYDKALIDRLSYLEVRTFEISGKRFGEKVAAGISLARGRMISFLEDDDKFIPTKLEVIYNLMKNHPDLNYVHNSSEILGLSNKAYKGEYTVHDYSICKNSNPNSSVATKELFTDLSKKRFGFNTSSMSIKKEVVSLYLTVFRECTALVDSILFYLTLDFDGLIIGVPDILTEYRLHESSSHSTKLDFKALDKFVDWSNQIEYSLDILRERIRGQQLKILLDQKKASVSLLKVIFDIDRSSMDIRTVIGKFKTSLANRKTYSILMMFLVILKRSIPQYLYRHLALLIYSIFLKGARRPLL